MVMHLPLSRGLVALVDDEDYDLLSEMKWCAKPRRSLSGGHYACKTIKPDQVYLHRFILNAQKGDIVDHINGDGLDNRRCNLRLTDLKGNAANKRIPLGVCGFRGVTRQARTGGNFAYRANAQSGGVILRSPYFDCPVVAAKYYDSFAKKLFGEFAHLNFPKSGAA